PLPAPHTILTYTTLFRSRAILGYSTSASDGRSSNVQEKESRMQSGGHARTICAALTLLLVLSGCAGQLSSLPTLPETAQGPYQRSEEHTSELQSRENLVC